jgi:hypothetical protein
MKNFLSKLSNWMTIVGYYRAMSHLRALGYTEEAANIAAKLKKIKAPV